MKPFRFTTGWAALGVLAIVAGPSEAAWNNVFQVTCNCRPRTSVGFLSVPTYSVPIAAAASPCCTPPQQVCTTRYVQRCYYQPVTTYQTRTFYEPVTTYQTKYFYEPVTSYRYSSYYDPCSCSYQQVATPVTAYQLRAQSCPVQTWAQRCASVPVTSYQQVSYWEPQTSCAPACPAPACAPAMPAAPPVAVAPPPAGMTLPPPPPGVQEQQQRQTPPPPTIGEQKSGIGGQPYQQYYGPLNDPNQYRQLPPGGGTQQTPQTPPPPMSAPGVKLERIVLDDEQRLDGQVVRQDKAPQANATVMFVSASREAPNQTVTANAQGQFQVSLARGGWLVYVASKDGRPIFHSRLDLDLQPPTTLTLTAQ